MLVNRLLSAHISDYIAFLQLGHEAIEGHKFVKTVKHTTVVLPILHMNFNVFSVPSTVQY